MHMSYVFYAANMNKLGNIYIGKYPVYRHSKHCESTI